MLEGDQRQQFFDLAALCGLCAAAHHIGGSCGDGQANGVFFAKPFRFGVGESGDHAVAGTHRAAHFDLQCRSVDHAVLAEIQRTPTSFMHFAFGMSDFDEKRYLRTILLGKGLMVAMMAVFGQSLVSSLKNPFYLVLSVLLWGGMYWVSKRFCRKHHLE